MKRVKNVQRKLLGIILISFRIFLPLISISQGRKDRTQSLRGFHWTPFVRIVFLFFFLIISLNEKRARVLHSGVRLMESKINGLN